MTFIILAFGITLLIADLPLVLAQNGFGVLPIHLPSEWLVLLGTALGMTGSAFYVTYITDGRTGCIKLLNQYFKGRVPPFWYGLVFTQAILLLLGVLRAGVPADQIFSNWKFLFTEFFPAALSILFFGQLWEEVGWRGFLLPRLQVRYGPFRSSLILAGLQTLWHAPGFFFAGGITAPNEKLIISGTYLASALVQTLVASLILGIFATWIYNSTKGSLLIVILFHTFSNASARMAFTHLTNPFVRLQASSTVSFGLILLTAFVLFYTRGRLGYQKEIE